MIATPEPSLVLSFEDARHLVERHATKLQPPGKEAIELVDSAGAVLAEQVIADRDFPPFRRSARDGYALRAADITRLPASLEIIGEIKAGTSPENIPNLQSGQAAVIMTGAAAPAGSDAVVMVEYTSRTGTRVQVSKGVEAGANIVPKGSEAKRGQPLLSPGARLDPAAIALAASAGRTRLLVYVRPRIAVVATGDELVDIDLRPGPNQIRNSNTYSLASQIRHAGGEPQLLPIAPDNPETLHQSIAEGLEADLLLLSGGVSMGKYDFVEQVLAEFHTEFLFTGVRIQPGRPVVFGRVPGGGGAPAREPQAAARSWRYFFGLPGNPVSTMVTFQLFAQPMVEALAGQTPRKLVFLHARLKSEIQTKTGLKRFLPAILSGEFEHAEVELARWGGSGDIAATALANCYVVVPADRERITAGEWVPVLMS